MRQCNTKSCKLRDFFRHNSIWKGQCDTIRWPLQWWTWTERIVFGVHCILVATGYDCSCLVSFCSYHSPHLWPTSPSSRTKGLAEITVLHCIKNDLPRGKLDWLKHGIRGYFPCGRMEAHSNAPAEHVHNTYLYLQSLEHLCLYTFHLCVASYLLTSGCVSHLFGQICLLCIFTIIIFIFLCSPCREKLQGINDGSRWQRKRKWLP